MNAWNSIVLIGSAAATRSLSTFLSVPRRSLATRTLSDARWTFGPETDGLAVLVGSAPDDLPALRTLLREGRLQNWPMRWVLTAVEPAVAASPLWTEMVDVVDASFLGPFQLADLDPWLQRQRPATRPFRDSSTIDDPSMVLRRELLDRTPSLAPLSESLLLAAAHDVTVLLEGETGSGKTHIARWIHQCSARRHERFLAVPCGALSAQLVESELFGHVRGAFTGADQNRQGKFAAAGRGTLLLDEIDALGLDQQANLLRVLETGEYEPVGSNDTRHVQARIIVASNWDLQAAAEAGTFRRDLYYRLGGLVVKLPPLRDRRGDIGPLARAMTARAAERFDKPLYTVSSEAIACLEAFDWPGNLRELDNAVQHAVMVCQDDELRPEHLPPWVREAVWSPTAASLRHHREAAEQSRLRRALEEAGQNRAAAARALGVSRMTLYKKMRKYGLIDPVVRQSARLTRPT